MASEAASLLIKVSKPNLVQAPDQTSFVGGRPKLPPALGLPLCKNCGAVQSFFFQVAFPKGQPWAGQSLAVFECTACRDEDCPIPMINKILVPTMPRMDLRRGEDIPDGALDLYQKVCRFLVFPTAEGVVRDDDPERVRYRPIAFDLAPDERPTAKSKLGGKPGWVEINLTPGKYLGEPLGFLMQWRHGFEFDRLPGSPPPYNPFMDVEPDLTANVGFYKLFHGTQLYFFGNQAESRHHVFMLATRA
jgi:hypothetical protein